MAKQLGKRLKYLLADRGYDDAEIVNKISKYGIGVRTVSRWLKKEDKTVDIRATGKESIRSCLKDHDIDIDMKWFEISFRDFKKAADANKKDNTKTTPKQEKRGIPKEYDKLTANKCKSIAGVYQIVRPHISSDKHYILEMMEISFDETKGAQISMFSHNVPHPKYLYSGELFVSNRYAMSLIKRTHEANDNRMAMRSVMLYIHSKQNSAKYAPRCCLSGLFLRGVEAVDTPAKAVSVPFVAFRPMDIDTTISDKKLSITQPKGGQFRELHKLHSRYLIGKIEKAPTNPIWYFCDRLFDSIETKSKHGIALYTVQPEELAKAVCPNATEHDTLFHQWKDLVANVVSA